MIKKLLYLGSLVLGILIVFYLNLPAYSQETITIKEYLQKVLPPQEGRKIILDPTTGLLTITDTPSNQKLIKRLIEKFDTGTPQVMIEAKFVEVTMDNIKEMGVEWYWHGSNAGNAPGFSNPYSMQTNVEGIQWGRLNKAGTYQAFPEEGHGLDLYIGKTTASNSDYLYAYLHALEEHGKANLLSAPRVTTLSGHMANVEVTKTFPYVSDVELENQGTADYPTWVLKQTYEEATTGISLEVTPHVSTQSNLITLDLHPTVKTLIAQRSIKPSASSASFPTVPSAVGWPVIDSRSTQTSIIVKSGDTIVLGGFIKEEETAYKRQIPVLAKLPLLGNLFKYNYTKKTKKNLLIFVTASLISADGSKIK